MKLRHNPASPYVRKVMVVAHELGLASRIELLDTAVSPVTTNATLAGENPLMKIPALVTDDGEVLFDSPVICEYLDNLAGGGLFPTGEARWTALRRQALGDGFLDMLVTLRNERERAHPSEVHMTSTTVRTAAVLRSLERETEALGAAPFGIGHIAIGCALSYLDFRFAEDDWRKGHPGIARWHAAFAARPSVRATEPIDDS